MNCAILGDGLMGSELYKQTSWDVFSRKKGFDALKFDIWKDSLATYDTIVNCMACTDTYSPDKNKHWLLNVEFVDKLVSFTNKTQKKLIHISTDYLYSNSVENASEDSVPVHLGTWYGYTKLIGDALVQLRSKKHLVCRLSHKPVPFPYNLAWQNIKTNCDGVDVIVNLVVKLIYKQATGVVNVGTEVKSIYDLALKTNKNVAAINRPENVPFDTSMNIEKLKQILNK
jgi:dTDP-4-dehydrorhamnose reductase